MTGYRRVRVPGGTYFFTVVTLQRRPLLVAHIDGLRDAFRRARALHRFEIDSLVVLPDHLHAIWRLPVGDADCSVRWSIIKRTFSRRLPEAAAHPRNAGGASAASGSGASGST